MIFRRAAATMLVEMGITLELFAVMVGHEAGGSRPPSLIRIRARACLNAGAWLMLETRALAG